MVEESWRRGTQSSGRRAAAAAEQLLWSLLQATVTWEHAATS